MCDKYKKNKIVVFCIWYGDMTGLCLHPDKLALGESCPTKGKPPGPTKGKPK